jgi:hypothetical protein
MKRSEMIDMMANKLCNYDDWFTERKGKEIMYLILNELELAGMLPPRDFNKLDDFDRPVHLWEPE